MIDHAQREQDIIGMLNTVMTRTEDISQVERYVNLISQDDFKSKSARIAFDYIKRAVSTSQPFDVFTLKDWVNNDARCNGEPIGSIVMDACHRNAPGYVSLGTNIRLQREYSGKVNALNYLEQLNRKFNECDNIKEVAGQAASFFEGVAGNLNVKTNNSKHVTEYAKQFVEQLEADQKDPEHSAGLTTGMQGLDELLGRRLMQPGTLMVIGGRPGSGKTAKMVHMMLAQAQANKDKAFIGYSMEMPGLSIYERMMANETGYSYDDILEVKEDDVYSMIAQAVSNLSSTSLYINETSQMGIADIESNAREMSKDQPIGALYVDYLTIMEMPKKDRHDLSVGEITRRLKRLSVELNCCVVLLAQLNRNIDDPSRKDKRPIAKDLRDSGSVEQDADYILFPYRDIIYNEQSLAREYAELILRKNRHGKTGAAYARFVNGRFIDCDQIEAESKCQAAKNDSDKPYEPYKKPEKGIM